MICEGLMEFCVYKKSEGVNNDSFLAEPEIRPKKNAANLKKVV